MPAPGEWLIFLGTAVVFAVTPGPAMLYVLARTLHGGRREGVASALGNAIGTLLHVLAAAIGLSTLLAASPTAYAAVKYVGAVYLAVLGVQALRECRRILPAGDRPGDRSGDVAGDMGGGTRGGTTVVAGRRRLSRSPLVQGIVVESLNPKTALYFMALLPHFVHPDRADPALVFGVLGSVVVVTVLAADVMVAFAAGRLHARLAADVRWQVRQRAGSGVVMIGLGAFVAVV